MRWFFPSPVSKSYGGLRYTIEKDSTGACTSKALPWITSSKTRFASLAR